MSDYRLAIKIAGELDGSLASAVNGAKSMLQSLTGTAGSAISSGASMLMRGNVATLAAIGAVAGKVIKESITQGMDFENAMADLAGTAGVAIGSEAYEAYEQAARQVGATTNKSATESAEALKYMALAGWDVTDSIQALDGMVKLSSASGMDMARTSDLVTDSMGALGLTMDDYARYMDFVATADAAANYTAEDFMETMIRSGGAARTLGIGYEELATAAGVLANNGEKGSQAGTSLNSILRRMATNGSAVTAMAKNGVKMFDDATGEFRGFETVLKDINTAMEDMTAEERIGFLSDVAGRYTSQFQYLLDSVKQGGDWGTLMGDAFGDVAGNLEQRYKTATDTLKGDMDILKSAAADFGIEMYQSMVGGTDGMRGAVQSMSGTISDLTSAFQTDGLTGLATQIGNEVANIATSISENESGAIEAATSFMTSLYQSLGSEGNSEAIGNAAAQIVTSLGTGFAETTGEFGVMAGNLISGVIDGMNDIEAGQQLADAISSAVSNVGDWFGENGGDLGAAAGQLIASLATGLAEHADELIPAGINIISGLVQGLIQGAAKLVGAMPAIIGSLIEGIPAALGAITQAGQGIGEALVEGIQSVISDFGEAFQGILNALFDVDFGSASAGVTEMFETNASAMSGAMREVWSNGMYLQDTFGVLYNDYLPKGTNVLGDQVSAWVQAGNTIQEVQEQVASVEGTDAYWLDSNTSMQQALDVYTELANASLETAQANVEAANAASLNAAAVKMVGENAESSSTALETVNSAMESLNSGDGLQGISDELQNMATGIEETQSAADGLKEALSFDGFAGDLATDLLQADDIQARADEISTAMQTVADNVSTSMTNLETTFSTLGTSIDTALNSASTSMSSFDTSVTSALTSVGTAFTELQTTVDAAMAAMAAAVQSGGAAAVAAAQSTAQGILAAFQSIDLSGVAANMMAGLTAGIQSGGAAAVAAAQSVASQVAAAMSSALAIHSPSRVTYDIGENAGAGFTNALWDAAPEAASAADALAKAGGYGLMQGQDQQDGAISRFNNMSYQGAGMMPGQQPQAQPQQSMGPVTFSPNITIQGNADESAVRNALQWGFDEFEKMMDRYMWQKGREAFAT